MAPPGGVPENGIMMKDISEQGACAPTTEYSAHMWDSQLRCDPGNGTVPIGPKAFTRKYKRISFCIILTAYILDEIFSHNIALAQQLLTDTHLSTQTPVLPSIM